MEEHRPMFSMKNEFLFSRVIIGKKKKRYISRERFDFKKSTTSIEESKVACESGAGLYLKDMVVTRGSIIRDNDTAELYLVLRVNHERNTLVCLDTNFDRCDLGINWLKCYSKVEDINMDYFVNLISDTPNM